MGAIVTLPKAEEDSVDENAKPTQHPDYLHREEKLAAVKQTPVSLPPSLPTHELPRLWHRAHTMCTATHRAHTMCTATHTPAPSVAPCTHHVYSYAPTCHVYSYAPCTHHVYSYAPTHHVYSYAPTCHVFRSVRFGSPHVCRHGTCAHHTTPSTAMPVRWCQWRPALTLLPAGDVCVCVCVCVCACARMCHVFTSATNRKRPRPRKRQATRATPSTSLLAIVFLCTARCPTHVARPAGTKSSTRMLCR